MRPTELFRIIVVVGLLVLCGMLYKAVGQVAPPPPAPYNMYAVQSGCTQAKKMQIFSYNNKYVWDKTRGTWVWGVRLFGCGFTKDSMVNLTNNATGERRNLVPLDIDTWSYPTSIDIAIPPDWIPGSGTQQAGTLLAKR